MRFLNKIASLRPVLGRVEGGPNILGRSDFKCYDFKTERASCFLNLACFEHGTGVVYVRQDRQAAKTGNCVAGFSYDISPSIRRPGI